MRGRLVSAAVVLAALVGFAAQTTVVQRIGFLNGDFSAFYCAARVASHGGDPYRLEPLRTCEVRIGSTRAFVKNPGVAIPAPLPGYAIAAFVPFSVLPFTVAATLWTLILIGCAIIAMAALARFGAIAWEVAVGLLALSLALLSVPFGEVVPIAIACICASAYFMWRGKPRAAALAAAGAMIEPHLGLPVCLSLALWSRPARLPLAVAAAVLAVASLALLGPGTNAEYFTSVLNAHALSELNRDTQYSLTAVLAGAGLSSGAAVKMGSLWYVLMVVLGVLAARPLAQRSSNAAFLICAPPAFAVFGGTFIHLTQIAAAIPAAVLAFSLANGRARTLALVALVALAVPWDWAASPSLFLTPAILVGYVAWRLEGTLQGALLAAVAAAALSFGLCEIVLNAPHAPMHAPIPPIDPRLAEASWAGSTQQTSTRALSTWLLRLPTWCGLALLLGVLLNESGLLRRLDYRRAPSIALAALCTLLPFAGQWYGDQHGGWLGVDVRAYYCAALAQREGRNPYFVQPLHACERATPRPYYRPADSVTVPAPYPPYALALFYPLTFLPFSLAAPLWWVLLAAALAAGAWALARLANQQFVVAWAALALSAGLGGFSAGNVMPLALAALIGGAWLVARARYGAASVALAVAALEPHVALPAVLGALIVLPRMRVPLLSALAALGAVSFMAGGFAHNALYLTEVLPAHALAEVSRDNQYSLSSVLAAFGVSDAAAVSFGNVSYAVMVAAGILAGARLVRQYADPALAVLVPAAFALLGGSFVHTLEIAAAVPACLVLYVHARTQRAPLFTALLLLAVPWMMATSAAMFLAPLYPVAFLTYALWKRDRATALVAALASFAVILGLFVLGAHAPAHAAQVRAHPAIDPRLAEASWRALVLGDSTNGVITWLLRIPTWIGLVAFTAAASALAFGASRAPSFDRLAYAKELRSSGS